MKSLLEVKSLNTYYGESHILRDVDLNVKSGEMVCLIGRNGVGKTTLLKSLIGLLKPKNGEINLIGENVNRKAPHQRARKGMAYVPQGREIIPYLTVEENLMLGMESLPGGLSKNKNIENAINLIIKETGIGVLLVEQHLHFVRQASRYYAMQRGGIVASGNTSELSQTVIDKFLSV